MSIHRPVLEDEVLHAFQNTRSPIRTYFDGTFGRGGHVRRVFENFPEIKIVAIDHDLEAIEHGKVIFSNEIKEGRLVLIHEDFSNFHQIKINDQPIGKFDIMLLDLGVSSPQLDQSERGFSFYSNGPLDMRMNKEQSLTASEIINTWDEKNLIKLFIEYGEVRKPYKVVKAILQDRVKKPFTETRELSSLIERVERWSRRHHHPATLYFLALRIAVNDELKKTESALPDLINGLELGGRLAIITFHSLEDRIVKYKLKSLLDLGNLVNKKVIKPTWNEIKRNPRARSAKLRIFERGLHGE